MGILIDRADFVHAADREALPTAGGPCRYCALGNRWCQVIEPVLKPTAR
jgi:hypothetical protein